MFYENFDSASDVCSQFGIAPSDLKGCKILFAVYETGNYEGHALVVFRKNRKLYEVNGSHCSCYGLEDQWDPELTSVEALRHYLQEGTLGYRLGGYMAEFQLMLDGLSRKKKVSG